MVKSDSSDLILSIAMQYLCQISDLDSWDSVDEKNGLTHLDWTPDTRDTKCVLKWVLVRIAAFCCARWPQIWIPETEYYQKVSSHAQIWPQGAEKQQSKVYVGGWYGGDCSDSLI